MAPSANETDGVAVVHAARPGLWALARQALSGVEQDFTQLPLRRAVFLLAVPMVMEMAMESLFAVADIFSVAFGLSMAATATVSRRVGEGDLDAASTAAGQVVLLAVGVSFAIGGAGFVWGKSLLASMGAAPCLFYAYGMVLTQAFNGAGDTRTPTLLNFACFWCFKIPAAYVLAVRLGLGPQGVFTAITLAYSALAVAGALLFRAGRWKTQRV